MIALVTATRMEMDAVLASVSIKCASPAEGCWEVSELSGRSLCLLVTGIGPVNAAWSLGMMLGSVQGLKGICNLGVAGSFDLERFALEAVAISRMEIWPEFGLRTEDDVLPQGLKLAQAPRGIRGQPGPVFDRLFLDPYADAGTMGLQLPEELPEAVSLSVAGVTADPEQARKFRTQYQADLENMEGFALAYGALRHGLPFVEILSVSNLVGSRDRKDWRLKQSLEQLERIGTLLF